MPIKGKQPQSNTTRDRSRFFKYFDDASGGDIDLYDEGPMDGSEMPCAEIHVLGDDGDLVVERVDGTSVTIPVRGGAVLPISVRKIVSSGTTATGFLVLW